VPDNLDEKDIETASALGPSERYAHFLKRVLETKELWSLKGDDGFVAMVDDEGHAGLPLWPHHRFAEQHATGELSSTQPARISLSDFINKWVGGMEKDGLKLVIFPTLGMQGIVVEPARLLADLSEELKQNESSREKSG
jgi:hypothetical protein